MEISAEVKMEKLFKTFSKLPASIQKKALKRALSKGAGVVKKAAIANVKSIVSSEATGTLAKSIQIASMKKYNGRLRYAVRIKPKAVNQLKKDKDGKPVRVGLYGAVLEYGKENQPPRSWLRKAARENTNQALQAISSEARSRMEDAIKDAKI